MANIDEYLRIILNGVYGRDVRKAIHDGIRKCYDDNASSAESVEGFVDTWLEEHPEATTTVEDGAITDVKFSDGLKTSLSKYEQKEKLIECSIDYIEHSAVYITSFSPTDVVFNNINGDNTTDATADKSLVDYAKTVDYPIMINSIWHNGYHINHGVIEYERKTDPSEWTTFCYYSGFNGNEIVFFDGLANPDYDSNDLLNIGETWGLTNPPVIVNYQGFDLASWKTTYAQNQTLIDHLDKLLYTENASQILAEDGNGRFHIFTFTGKGNGFMKGVTYSKIQSYLLNFNTSIKNAMYLDGGGSTQTVINKLSIIRTQDRSSVNGRLIPIALCFDI